MSDVQYLNINGTNYDIAAKHDSAGNVIVDTYEKKINNPRVFVFDTSTSYVTNSEWFNYYIAATSYVTNKNVDLNSKVLNKILSEKGYHNRIVYAKDLQMGDILYASSNNYISWYIQIISSTMMKLIPLKSPQICESQGYMGSYATSSNDTNQRLAQLDGGANGRWYHIWGHEKKEHGELTVQQRTTIYTDSDCQLYVSGDNGFWGSTYLSISCFVPAGTTYYLFGRNIEKVYVHYYY